MNVDPSPPDGDARAQLGRLVTVPVERELPGGRHKILRECLMQEYERQNNVTAPLLKRPRARVRLALAVAAVVVGISAAVAVPFVLDQRQTPAYAVTTLDDGRVRVDLNDVNDLDGLQRDLAGAGVRAVVEVDYLPVGKMCKQPRYSHAAGEEDAIDFTHHDDGSNDLTLLMIDPAALGDGMTLVVAVSIHKMPDERVVGSSFHFGVADGPVRPCEPVDDPHVESVTVVPNSGPR